MDLKEIGALWVGKDKNGNTMLSGNLESAQGKKKILAFKNRYKNDEKQPDYRIYLAKG